MKVLGVRCGYRCAAPGGVVRKPRTCPGSKLNQSLVVFCTLPTQPPYSTANLGLSSSLGSASIAISDARSYKFVATSTTQFTETGHFHTFEIISIVA